MPLHAWHRLRGGQVSRVGGASRVTGWECPKEQGTPFFCHFQEERDTYYIRTKFFQINAPMRATQANHMLPSPMMQNVNISSPWDIDIK